MKKLLQQALDALETGLDCTRDKAENIHESYKGYYPERHAQADKDVAYIEATIEALRAAIDRPEPYDQQALEPCGVCGWKTIIPGEPCLMCERNAKMLQPESEDKNDKK